MSLNPSELVLVADDDPTVRSILRRVLTQFGYRSIVVDNGNEAFRQLEAPAGPQLAILDWMMPGKNGLEVISLLRQMNPARSLHIMLLTGKNGRDDIVAAMQAGANDFLSKPIDIEQFRARVEMGRQRVALMREVDALRSFDARNSQLASIGVLAAGVAHEVNNPLMIISGLAHQLKREAAKLSPQGQSNVLKIGEQTDRITRITRSLLRFGQEGQSEKVEVIKAGSLFTICLNLCQRRFESHQVGLEFSGESEAEFEGQTGALGQALYHLLENAFEAVRGHTEKWVRVDVVAASDRIEIAVTDSGVGIAPELHEKIFQPFFTTKDVGQGMGLGLSVANSIVIHHGGSLKLDPHAPNTRFLISLPRRFEAKQAA